MRLVRKLICISSSDAASSFHVLCRCSGNYSVRKKQKSKQTYKKTNYENEDKKVGTRGKITTALHTRKRQSDKPYIKMDDNRGSIFSTDSCSSYRILKSWPKFLWITSVSFPCNNLISVHFGLGRPMTPLLPCSH